MHPALRHAGAQALGGEGDEAVMVRRPAGSGAGDNRLAGTIRAITYMGATLKLMVDVPGHGAIEVHVPTWRNTGQFSESQAVDLCWSNDAQVEVEGGDGEEAGARPA